VREATETSVTHELKGGGRVTGSTAGWEGRVIVVPEVWADFYEATNIPAAVWVGDTLRVTGHTGESADGVYPDGPEAQTRGTFQNLTVTLAEAGVDWRHVVEITSYRVGLRSQQDVILEVAGEYLEAPYPAWTDVGVTALYPPDALVEISCVAVDLSRRP
jgi:enamine deaminase RidA (YjgF/YER057c/UK114 family)